MATTEDYETVRLLVEPMYQSAVTGVSEQMRLMVGAVAELHDQGTGAVSVSVVAKHLGVSKASVSRRAKDALKQGWLVNAESRKGHAYRLEVGEPLPETSGLPTAVQIDACYGVAAVTDSEDLVGEWEYSLREERAGR